MFSVNAVSAQSGYWLLPRNPSCAKVSQKRRSWPAKMADDPAEAIHRQQACERVLIADTLEAAAELAAGKPQLID